MKKGAKTSPRLQPSPSTAADASAHEEDLASATAASSRGLEPNETNQTSMPSVAKKPTPANSTPTTRKQDKVGNNANKFSPKKRKEDDNSFAPMPKFAAAFKPKKQRDDPGAELFLGKYADNGLPWGLPSEEPVWCMLLKDSGRPALDYMFLEAFASFLKNNIAGWPQNIEEMAACGIVFVQPAPHDRDS